MKRLMRVWAVLLLTVAASGAAGRWASAAEDSSVTPGQDQVRLFDPYRRPKNGPPLTNVFDKVELSWLGAKLKDPTYHPAARMPDFKFSDGEVTDVIAYLKSILEDPSGPPVEWPSWAHKGFVEVAETPADLEAMLKAIEDGKALWGNARCSICHSVGGPGGELIGGFVDLRVGCIDLQIVGTKVKRDWLYAWLKDPKSHFPSTLMPRFRFTDEQAMALVEYLLRDDSFFPSTELEPPDSQREAALDDPQRVAAGKLLIETSRCVVCHKIEGIEEVFRLPKRQATPPEGGVEHLVYDLRCLSCHTIDGRGGTYAPDLTSAGSRLQEAWIPTFLESPDMLRLLSQQMPKLNLTAEEAGTLASYLTAVRRDEQIPETIPGLPSVGRLENAPPNGLVTPEEVELGRQAFKTQGCLSCHPIGEGEGGGVAPDLAAVADRLKPGYLWYHLKQPHAVNPYSAEPDYGFSDEEARTLAAYLSTKKAPEANGDTSGFRPPNRHGNDEPLSATAGGPSAIFHPTAALALLGAAGEEPTSEEPTDTVPTSEEPTVPREEFINRRRQVQGAALMTREGLYAHYCAHCHGEQGKGGGRLWTTGESRPALSDLGATQLDQAALVKFITEGSAASGRSNFCPPWGQAISPPNVQRLARHIVSLSGTEEPPPPAEPQLAEEPFPWGLLGLILAEVGLLVWMILRNRELSHALPKNSAVR